MACVNIVFTVLKWRAKLGRSTYFYIYSNICDKEEAALETLLFYYLFLLAKSFEFSFFTDALETTRKVHCRFPFLYTFFAVFRFVCFHY